MKDSVESLEVFKERLVLARSRLLRAEPFIGFMTLELPTHVLDGVNKVTPTAATDGCGYFYNYRWCRQLTDAELVFVIAHEVAHVLFLHGLRRNGRQADLWNAACDFAINGLLHSSCHCLLSEIAPSISWGDQRVEPITTQGREIHTFPLAVELCADIAVLGAPNHECWQKELEVYESFCSTTKPVPMARNPIKPLTKVPVCILGEDGRWIKGVAEIFTKNSKSLSIKADEEIRGGCSGGPVLNQKGELLAIVSNSTIPTGRVPSTGLCPRPLYALPVWVCREFFMT